MKIIRWAIIMPVSQNQFESAEDYTVARRTLEDCNEKGGIELKNREETTFKGMKAYKTTKMYRIRDRIPAVIKWALPNGITCLVEEMTSSFPERVYEYSIPGHENILHMKLESETKPYHYGDRIEDGGYDLLYLDVLNWDGKNKETSIEGFECKDAGIEKLPMASKLHKKHIPEWVKTYHGELTITYKTLQAEVNIFGASSTIEGLLTSSIMPNIFADTHKEMIRSANEWCKMNTESVANYENRVYSRVNSELRRNNCQ